MIPYADLERALARWKIRRAGGETAAAAESYAATGEIATSEFDEAAPTRLEQDTSSGAIQLGDAELEDEG